MNAATGKEFTAFYARLPAGGQDLAVDLLGDVLCGPALRAADVETERRVILEELHLQEDDPSDVVASLLDEALFPDHDLGREVLGTRKSVEALDRDGNVVGSDTITVTRGDGEQVRLVKRDGRWILPDYYDFPAPIIQIRPTLTTLQQY